MQDKHEISSQDKPEINLEDTIKLFFKMYIDILVSNDFPIFSTCFQEDDARGNLANYLLNHFKDSDYLIHEGVSDNDIEDIKDKLKENVLNDDVKVDENGDAVPTIFVKNYKMFFELLRQYCNKAQYLHKFIPKDKSYFLWRARELMKDIWLRAEPEDFNNIEDFLQKQVQMAEYKQDRRFRTEQELGCVPFLGYQHLTIQSQPAESFDENALEFIFRLSDDGQESIELPRVRYGIFERDGKTFCNIGSIQDKERKRDKKLEKNKYKINADINPDDLNVEPKKAISLILAISIMESIGIKDFEFSGLRVLDYKYHELLSEIKWKEFFKIFPADKTPRNIEYYEQCLKERDRYHNQQNRISESKTTGLFDLANRALRHFTNGEMTAFPFQVDSNCTIRIPGISESSINGVATKQLYSGVSAVFQIDR